MSMQCSSDSIRYWAGAAAERRVSQPAFPVPLTKTVLPYPCSFGECGAWARAAGVCEEVALQRFIAYAVLRCIAGSGSLKRRMILRGGAALWLRYGGRRPFDDIDFICEGIDEDPKSPSSVALTNDVNDVLDRELFKHFPNDPKWESLLLSRIKIEIISSFALLPYQWVRLGPVGTGSAGGCAMRVADLERMLAEKLTALLQHAARSRKRGKDVADIALMMNAHRDHINYRTVGTILTQIAESKCLQVPVEQKHFEGAIRDGSIATYEAAIALTSAELTFEAAWERVMELVRRSGE